MNLRDYDAANELYRVSTLSAFNVNGAVSRCKLNQHAKLYVFADGSKMTLRLSSGTGDAWHPSWRGTREDIHLGPIQGLPMHNKSIGYHTRQSGKNTIKVCGGSFGGSFDLETANRLIKQHFTVKAKPSGTLVFVDRANREVSLYFTVDPEITDAGKIARAEHNRTKEAIQKVEDQKLAELADRLESMTVDEALRKLSE